MTQLHGNLRKMITSADTPVTYRLPIGEVELPLNELLGQTLRLEYSGEIACIACGQRTKKSFNQGYCYRCFTTLAQCDMCIVKPELCHFAQGTCREPEWGLAHCMQPHYVYLANSSGLKVGITRASQVPTRWLDQGASQALLCLRVPSRRHAGLLEVALKRFVADRTDWRKMLSGDPAPHDLIASRTDLLDRCHDVVSQLNAFAEEPSVAHLPEEAARTFAYPILQYPKKVSSLSFDKTALVEGTLLGIKGQYLILDTGVLNIRKFAGYHVSFTI
ncbi:MAG: DUF2797 domain-containing protein [Deltaproteobacteria bacterium]|nr:DUF2797 domain-containing protein [Deltaproteobacteria bacterium]